MSLNFNIGAQSFDNLPERRRRFFSPNRREISLNYLDQPVVLSEGLISFQKDHKKYTYKFEDKQIEVRNEWGLVDEDPLGVKFFVEQVLVSNEIPQELKQEVIQAETVYVLSNTRAADRYLIYEDRPIALSEGLISLHRDHKRYIYNLEKKEIKVINEWEMGVNDPIGVKFFVEQVLESNEIPEELKQEVKQAEACISSSNANRYRGPLNYADRPVTLKEGLISFHKDHKRYIYKMEKKQIEVFSEMGWVVQDPEGVKVFVEQVLESNEIPEELKQEITQVAALKSEAQPLAEVSRNDK